MDAPLGIEGCLSIPGLYFEQVERAEYGVQVSLSGRRSGEKTHTIRSAGPLRPCHSARTRPSRRRFCSPTGYPKAERQAFVDEHRKVLADMQREAKAFLKDLKVNS